LRGGTFYKGKEKESKGLKAQGKGKVKVRGKERGPKVSKGRRGKERGPKVSKGRRVPCFKRLAGTSSRDFKASKKGFYYTRFTCKCFPCCIFSLRPSIYIYSKLVFPMGGFSRVMLTKSICVNFMHA
jgi:hypothetical protein